ncbi:MAG: hypothetical protein L0332_27055 [Chloroflexi bacterium]|nr:hypothetical protein [Chloroflexota bacterium]MCI0580060.1 hypothetical protein [Chloroflexota bacterium]MCI0649640.1 hypothetical protein [Chloroflexota bacterium]MCI0730358.1 hypothetical protein [Chloroflexota bacterium]
MLQQPPTTPTRVRIYTHVTQSRFLHVEDALNIGKVRLFAGNYRRGEGMDSHAYHFIDLADARVILGALARSEAGFSHKEYKGTPPQNGRPAVSRVLSVAVKGENVYVELKTGPGKLTNTGAIAPNGPAVVEVNVAFKLYEARRMATAVLAYLEAWDVLRMLVNQHLVGQPAPYLLSPVNADGSAAPATSANGAPKPVTTPRPTAVASTADRPVTRKGPVPRVATTNGAARKTANGKPAAPVRPAANAPDQPGEAVVARAAGKASESPTPPQRPLQYQDGTPVDAGNAAEMQTFQRFMAEKQIAPESKAVLQAYYRQLAAA